MSFFMMFLLLWAAMEQVKSQNSHSEVQACNFTALPEFATNIFEL